MRRSLLAKDRFRRGAVHPKLRPWTETDEAVLGTMPDCEVARKLGRTEDAVRHRRIALKIRLSISSRRWTKVEERLLGSGSDREIAKLRGSVERGQAFGIAPFPQSGSIRFEKGGH